MDFNVTVAKRLPHLPNFLALQYDIVDPQLYEVSRSCV